MPCTFFHFVLKRLLPVGLIGLCSTFCVSKGGIHARMSFLLLLLLFPITQGVFLPIFLARICSRKPYLTFVYGYKRVLGSLQAGRCTRYPAIIETPAWCIHESKKNHQVGLGRKSHLSKLIVLFINLTNGNGISDWCSVVTACELFNWEGNDWLHWEAMCCFESSNLAFEESLQ